MWHASVSIWTPDRKHQINRPDMALREAVALLAGVGGDLEWWTYATGPARQLVGYLRVPVTEAEYQLCPTGTVVADAEWAGEQRPRTYPPGKGHK